MTDILEAICNIVEQQNFDVRAMYSGKNQANAMGESLESYIKDAFAGTLGISDESQKMKIYNQKFSWLGSQNNPPDIMIKGGDAIEVKKIQSANSSHIALNSSYPKDYLMREDPMVTIGCKECEEWSKKDLIYCVGHTTDEKLKSLWMIYGHSYAAKHEIYQRIKTTISSGVETIPDVVFSKTKELGRVNQVDPLGITSLRIRGMWQIENPRRVFNYLHQSTYENFELVCIIPTDKYNKFTQESREKIERISESSFAIEDKQIKDPNNPAKLIDCKLITFCI